MSDHQLLSKLGLVLDTLELTLVCAHPECRYALQPTAKRVHSHLWEKHGISQNDRQGLTAYLRSIALIDPRRLPPRKDGSEAHPYLSRHVGYVCRLCPVRSTSIKIIDQHIRESHNVELLQRSRELYRVRDRVYLQSWVLEGSRRYWIVLGDASMECLDATRPPQGRISTSSHLDHIYESERARIGDIQASLRHTTTDDNLDLSQIAPWMQRTQWFDTYRGARRDILIHLTTIPNHHSRRWGLLLGVIYTAKPNMYIRMNG